MSMATDTGAIEQLIEAEYPDFPIEGNYIFGYSEGGIKATLKHGKFAALETESYVLAVSTEQIILFEVSKTGRLTGESSYIFAEDIASFKVRKSLLQNIITIGLTGGNQKIKLKCNKAILGMDWQKQHTKNLVNQDWYGLA